MFARTSPALSALVVTMAVLAPSAHATTGGASHIDWIGWDAESTTLWWRDRAGGECEPCPASYWSLASSETAPVERELTGAELRALRRTATTLRAPVLRASARGAFTVEMEITERARARVAPDLPSIVRLSLAVHVSERRDGSTTRQAHAQLVAFHRQRVRIVRTAEIPGRAETLVVLRYAGVPYESGYDDETIAILR